MCLMCVGEDPTNSNPANKAARDLALTCLVSLLKGMKSAPTARATMYVAELKSALWQ